MIGEELDPSPVSWTFHLRFSVSLQRIGGLPSGETADIAGPRQVGQYGSDEAPEAKEMIKIRVKDSENAVF
jgi:hypothetical protein